MLSDNLFQTAVRVNREKTSSNKHQQRIHYKQYAMLQNNPFQTVFNNIIFNNIRKKAAKNFQIENSKIATCSRFSESLWTKVCHKIITQEEFKKIQRIKEIQKCGD